MHGGGRCGSICAWIIHFLGLGGVFLSILTGLDYDVYASCKFTFGILRTTYSPRANSLFFLRPFAVWDKGSRASPFDNCDTSIESLFLNSCRKLYENGLIERFVNNASCLG